MIAWLIPILWLGAAFLALFGIAELLYHKLRVAAEHTRSIVHAGTGLLTLLFPVVLGELWQVVILCGTFFVLLIASLRFGWLRSINAVQRRSKGSLLYPLIVVICFAFRQRMAFAADAVFAPAFYYLVPILMLALGDPLAALAGRAYRQRHPEAAPGKTFAGSFVFFGIAAAIYMLAAAAFTQGRMPGGYFIATGIATAYATTLAERFSEGGWDNLSIPLVAIGCIAATDYAL